MPEQSLGWFPTPATVITHLAFSAGWLPASTAMGIARKAFEEAGA